MVAAGILLSRLLGLVRNRVLAHYFGTSDAADAFNAAFRIPNVLQNLFGEGVLSASFIPVYAGLHGRGEARAARETAGAVAALLGLAVSVLVLLGVLFTPVLIDLIAPGFEGEKRAATIGLVRIFFPGAGLLVLSAWCLGILNSHRHFFLSYAAPVVWNLAIIGALMGFGGRFAGYPLAEIAAWGAVAGSLAQFLVQLPTVVRLRGAARPAGLLGQPVRTVLANFWPVFVGRGVVQISAYVDTLLASLLPTGAVAGVAYAQVLYTLPVSLFGMSVSAAELPEMSSAGGERDARAAVLRERLARGLRQIAFFVVPSAVVFVALGDVVTAALYQTGEFTRAMAVYVWAILAGASVGLLPATLARLYASTYYALHDTRTPLRFALLRVGVGLGLGYLFALHLPPVLGLEQRWGAAGLTLASALAGSLEYLLLKRALGRRIGPAGLPGGFLARVGGAAALGGGAAWLLGAALPVQRPVIGAIFVLGTFGVVYLGATYAAGLPEARGAAARILRRQA
ncbi:MAG TPA: murein biosynthesis integral membrane protein MurJ [Gemmatimonadales bacterium]|nr:murein biosynthesis integral membrane protein MurJ [Gemmatimonadales bacterium]